MGEGEGGEGRKEGRRKGEGGKGLKEHSHDLPTPLSGLCDRRTNLNLGIGSLGLSE